jgi:hypothetical protein
MGPVLSHHFPEYYVLLASIFYELCFVPVKMYGNNPRKLFVKIMRNNDVRMNEFIEYQR